MSKSRKFYYDSRAACGDDKPRPPKSESKPKPDFIKEGEFKI
jgi:hypothetical protein